MEGIVGERVRDGELAAASLQMGFLECFLCLLKSFKMIPDFVDSLLTYVVQCVYSA